MFVRDTTKTLFQVMRDFDCACDPEQRWKDLRAGVGYYNAYANTQHEFTLPLLDLYWEWICNTKIIFSNEESF